MKITNLEETKGTSKRVSKDIEIPRGSKEGIESGGKGINSGSGSQDLQGVGGVESRGKRVVEKPQKY